MSKWLLFGVSLAALGLFIGQRESARRDAFLRGYARDQFDNPGDDADAFEAASEIAATEGLPLKWVRALQRQVPPSQLRRAARAAKQAWQFPPDASAEALERSREAAIAAGVRRVS